VDVADLESDKEMQQQQPQHQQPQQMLCGQWEPMAQSGDDNLQKQIGESNEQLAGKVDPLNKVRVT